MRSFCDSHVLLIGKIEASIYREAIEAGVQSIEKQIEELDIHCDWTAKFDVGQVPQAIFERREKRQALLVHKAHLHNLFVALDK